MHANHDCCMHANHDCCMHANHDCCMHANHDCCMHANHDCCMPPMTARYLLHSTAQNYSTQLMGLYPGWLMCHTLTLCDCARLQEQCYHELDTELVTKFADQQMRRVAVSTASTGSVVMQLLSRARPDLVQAYRECLLGAFANSLIHLHTGAAYMLI
jgi:hypothetical protein